MAALSIQRAFDLALEHHRAGRLTEAERLYTRILDQQPAHAQAMHHLGVIADQMGRHEAAIELIRQSLSVKSDCAEAFSNLGNALYHAGQLEQAILAYRQAVLLNPHSAQNHGNLAIALKHNGQFDESIAAYRQAIAIRPTHAITHNNLANVLVRSGQLDEAITVYQRAIELKPTYAEAYSHLGIALKAVGRLDEAVAAFRKAIELRPDFAAAQGNLLYTLNYHVEYDARAIADELRGWNLKHAVHLAPARESHVAQSNPDRQLRIGYVSPDLRDHALGRNLLPIFRQHDRQQFDLTCYAQVRSPDEITRQFRAGAHRWRSIVGLSDEQVADQIRADGIDILVDLTMHMANHRLLVFARRPAPVQVTWLAYPASTGLGAMHYRLSDPYLDPAGMDESIYTERTIRLPNSYWCYDPLENRDIWVNALPALERGWVTFGCLNNFCKVNDRMLALWAQVMRNVDGSRLLLLAPRGSHRERTTAFLAGEGIEGHRVEFVDPRPRRNYLELYHRIDVGLDSFPYNGHTTSLDSFWMGVPVVTLAGQRAVSRAGWSQLSNLDLTELAGETPEQFAGVAVALAKDLPRLAALRAMLRHRMEQSPLMDAARFARNLEAAYRQMWRARCERGSKCNR